ncbi:MAG: hypothetical protein IJE43_03450, partial [Alphaproteobacteria bacterium]|nr:hypothetical protein [Alphaproteobacteria bacterium]
ILDVILSIPLKFVTKIRQICDTAKEIHLKPPKDLSQKYRKFVTRYKKWVRNGITQSLTRPYV